MLLRLRIWAWASWAWAGADDTSARDAPPRYAAAVTVPATHHVLTAELLSIGSELTVGDTRDTNAGELARSLTSLGVRVLRLTALPDDLASVTAAFSDGLSRADLVVSTGGLGPTPDDLTREAIAAACDETVAVDPATEAWLRELWTRRGMPVPGAQPQAGVADPVGGGTARTRTALRPAGSSAGRAAA